MPSERDAGSSGSEFDAAGHAWRLGRFPSLMQQRIESILLVSSPYDSFILEEDGLLTELIFSEYTDLGLTHAPQMTRVSTGEAALAAIRGGRFDLVISMMRLGDMDLATFVSAVGQFAPALPIVVLAASAWELAQQPLPVIPQQRVDAFVWHGDPKLFLAIIKMLEDRANADHDTRVGGVGVIIFIEDSVGVRSSLLPIMYTELVRQARAVMADGINRMTRQLRMRARPKILVAENHEQGLALYRQFRKHLFGIIVDVRMPRHGLSDPRAGLDFVRLLKSESPDLPILVQSSEPENRWRAQALGASFIDKGATTLHRDVAEFMLSNFGFGDFIFRMPDSREVARAADLREMARVLEWVPAVSIEYHARRNHFSNWLRARTEFELAGRLRPRKVSEFGDIEGLRQYLIRVIRETLRQNRRGLVEDFSRDRYDTGSSFARIGAGSLGGKARGLAFMDALLARHKLDHAFPGVRLIVPRSLVIGTDVFTRFLERNELRWFGLHSDDDERVAESFRRASLPDDVRDDLRAFLSSARYPIAVRSSSLLEDSPYHPFAGVYCTHMIPNNAADDAVRLMQLENAIKAVYASTFMKAARQYVASTPYSLEEQQMGVILQQIVGARYGDYYYPSFAGVACSYNFYPFGDMQPDEGVAHVVLGLGALVMEGGEALRFCPTQPQVLPQLASVREFLDLSQRGFYALDLGAGQPPTTGRISAADDSPAAVEPPPAGSADEQANLVRLDLDVAEGHGTLAPVGSVWSADDDALHDGIHRPGVRVVTFAHVLKSGLFPLAPILQRLLALGRQGMNGPVEIEFAVNLAAEPKEFAILQIRPYMAVGQMLAVTVEDLPADRLLCRSLRALGHGVISDIRDVVYVVPERFDNLKTREIAREVGLYNHALREAGRPYVLIGPGRWGSANPALGIPVQWGQVSGARVIVEAGLDHFRVDPSQGSHFFHNLTSLGIAYFTVDPRRAGDVLDWDWLAAQTADGPERVLRGAGPPSEVAYVRHLRLAQPLSVRIDGRRLLGVMAKP